MTGQPLSSFCCVSLQPLKDTREENVSTLQRIKQFPLLLFWAPPWTVLVQGGGLSPFHTAMQFLTFSSGSQHELPWRKDPDGSYHPFFSALLSFGENHTFGFLGQTLQMALLKNDKWPGPEIHYLPKLHGESCISDSWLTVQCCCSCPGLSWRYCLQLFQISSPAQVHTPIWKSLGLLLPSEIFGLK